MAGTKAASASPAKPAAKPRKTAAPVVAAPPLPPSAADAAAATVVQPPAAPGRGVAGSAGAGAGAGVHAGQELAGGGPRFGRRAKILAVALAAVIVGAVAVTAVATGNGDDSTAEAAASPSATASPSSPSAAATTASQTASPSASASPATPTVTATPSATAAVPPSKSPTVSPTAAHVPASPAASPTKSADPAPGPHVASVAISSFDCSTGSGTVTAKVLIQYDGTAAGTLHLTWWRSGTGQPGGAVTSGRQTVKFPKGATSYLFTDKFSFRADREHPYVGLTVSTDPGADSGNGSFRAGCH